MREHLEPLLLSYSAPALTSADLEILDDLTREISATDDIDRFLELDRLFHLGTYQRARTSQLGDLVDKLWNTTQPYRRAYTRSLGAEARRIADEEHHLIMCALRDGDIDEAGRVVASHIRRTRRQLSRHPELFGRPPASPAPVA